MISSLLTTIDSYFMFDFSRRWCFVSRCSSFDDEYYCPYKDLAVNQVRIKSSFEIQKDRENLEFVPISFGYTESFSCLRIPARLTWYICHWKTKYFRKVCNKLKDFYDPFWRIVIESYCAILSFDHNTFDIFMIRLFKISQSSGKRSIFLKWLFTLNRVRERISASICECDILVLPSLRRSVVWCLSRSSHLVERWCKNCSLRFAKKWIQTSYSHEFTFARYWLSKDSYIYISLNCDRTRFWRIHFQLLSLIFEDGFEDSVCVTCVSLWLLYAIWSLISSLSWVLCHWNLTNIFSMSEVNSLWYFQYHLSRRIWM